MQSNTPYHFDVDKYNFKDVYAYIKNNDLVAKSTFISFDLELTGIKPDQQDRYEEFIFERYLKTRKVCMKYNIIQWGICFFIETKDQGIMAYPFNFYMFPQELKHFLKIFFRDEGIVQLQTGAVQFNTQHGMDWNRWIRDGIGFVSEWKYAQLKERYLDFVEKTTNESIELNAQAFAKIEQQPMTDIQKSMFKGYVDQIHAFAVDSAQNELSIVDSNSFHRKYLYSFLGHKYPQIFIDRGDEGALTLYKCNEEEFKQKLWQKQLTRVDRFKELIGVTQLWNDLKQAKKPIVGHNCFTDILFLYSHFVGCPPVDYDQFKSQFAGYFPQVFDTKYLVQKVKSLSHINGQLSQTALEDLYNYFTKKHSDKIDVKLPEEFDTKEAYHNAGFDAYATGIVYLNLRQLGNINELQESVGKLTQYKSNFTLNLLGNDIQLQQSIWHFVRLPEIRAEKSNNEKFQMIQQIAKPLMDKLSKFEDQFLINQKIINYLYIFIEIKDGEERLFIFIKFLIRDKTFEQILHITQQFIMKQKDQKFASLTFNQYYIERRQQREKEVKFERFDRR